LPPKAYDPNTRNQATSGVISGLGEQHNINLNGDGLM